MAVTDAGAGASRPAPEIRTSSVAATGAAPAPAATKPSGRGALTLIVNPIATTVSLKHTDQIRAALAERFDVTMVRTEAKGHATDLAQEAVLAGADVVAVYAGDGTTNEAIRALAGTHTALAHLPGGNASVLARMLGMGSDGVKAARRVGQLGHATRSIDLGYVDGRPFSFTAGIGLDGAVVKLVDSDLARKHRFRWGAFWMEAVRLAREEYFTADPMITVSSGGASQRGVTAIVQNAEAYTYLGPRPLTVGEGASLTSGTLTASALLSGLGWRDVPSITFRTVGPVRAGGHPRIHPLPASTEVTVSCDRPMPMQIDGDYWKDITEATFTVRPAALRVVA
ncbi:MAG: diacylglycerol kinase family protein [Solirubrobacteraceae bacterium]|nr:diacylglycerol kinase family protein [Solirubrobacteraceae bacterium]